MAGRDAVPWLTLVAQVAIHNQSVVIQSFPMHPPSRQCQSLQMSAISASRADGALFPWRDRLVLLCLVIGAWWVAHRASPAQTLPHWAENPCVGCGWVESVSAWPLGGGRANEARMHVRMPDGALRELPRVGHAGVGACVCGDPAVPATDLQDLNLSGMT